MERYELQKLRDLPIEGVAERLGMHVVRHKALCPFHDDHHASLTFNVRRNTYRCFACDAHGGVIDLAMALLPSRGGREGAFLDACKWLADGSNIILTEYKPKEMRPPKPFDAQRYERFFEPIRCSFSSTQDEGIFFCAGLKVFVCAPAIKFFKDL